MTSMQPRALFLINTVTAHGHLLTNGGTFLSLIRVMSSLYSVTVLLMTFAEGGETLKRLSTKAFQ